MPDDDLQRERLLSYFNGYEAGKADAAKETCVVLTEEERAVLEDIVVNDTYISNFAAMKLRDILARSAQPADTVTVRREVAETARDVYRWVLICNDPPPMSLLGRMCEASQLAEAALSTQPKGDTE